MHQYWYHIVLRQVIVVQRVEVEGVGTRVCFAEVRISCAAEKQINCHITYTQAGGLVVQQWYKSTLLYSHLHVSTTFLRA
eukprot:COSAG05_NODE_3351_length_2132_cov_1.230694_3_plen_80_part_00